MPYLLRAAGVSHIGSYRGTNQDAAFVSEAASGVADGVGGGPAGELASAALVHRLVGVASGIRSVSGVLERVRLSNWELAWQGRRDPEVQGMATTLTALFAGELGLILAHVGDSRAYRLRDGRLTRMTRDDSYVQALVDAGLVAPEAAAQHPHRNLVTASLGGAQTDGDAVHVSEVDAQEGDRWLLCSDGVSDYLPDDLLLQLLAADLTPAAAGELVTEAALSAGSRDNVTAVVCDIVRGTAVPTPAVFLGAAAEAFDAEASGTA